MTGTQQSLAHMRADEASPTRHQEIHRAAD
jgi:hypothetical protein